jgi:hypothetical protein
MRMQMVRLFYDEVRQHPGTPPALFLLGTGVGSMTNILPYWIAPIALTASGIWFVYICTAIWSTRRPLASWRFWMPALLLFAIGAGFLNWLTIPAVKNAELRDARSAIAQSIGRCGVNLGAKDGYETLAKWGENLRRFDFNCADLSGISLPKGTSFHLEQNEGGPLTILKANLSGATLAGVNLVGTLLSASDFSNANLTNADVSWSVLGAHVFYQSQGGTTPPIALCYPGANLTGADLTGANLGHSWLLGVRGLTCDQLKRAQNWEITHRDPDLECGKPIPVLQVYEYTKHWPMACPANR